MADELVHIMYNAILKSYSCDSDITLSTSHNESSKCTTYRTRLFQIKVVLIHEKKSLSVF